MSSTRLGVSTLAKLGVLVLLEVVLLTTAVPLVTFFSTEVNEVAKAFLSTLGSLLEIEMLTEGALPSVVVWLVVRQL